MKKKKEDCLIEFFSEEIPAGMQESVENQIGNLFCELYGLKDKPESNYVTKNKFIFLLEYYFSKTYSNASKILNQIDINKYYDMVIPKIPSLQLSMHRQEYQTPSIFISVFIFYLPKSC